MHQLSSRCLVFWGKTIISSLQTFLEDLRNEITPSRSLGWLKSKSQVLARVWRKGNTQTLLAGMQNGTVTVENRTAVPQKFKNRATI